MVNYAPTWRIGLIGRLIQFFEHCHYLRQRNELRQQVASFCDKYKITHRFSSPNYPQGNDQAEISNRTILDNLCKILGKAEDKYAEKLLGVFWDYRTTKRAPTDETPVLPGIRNISNYPSRLQHADTPSGRSGPRPE